MNRKWILSLLLVISVMLQPVPAPAAAAAAQQQVLLLYDSLAKGTEREGNVTELQRLLAAYSVKVTLLNLNEYRQGELSAYSGVITVMNRSGVDLTNEAYLSDAEEYPEKILHVGYYLPAFMQRALQLSQAEIPGGNASLSIGEFFSAAVNVPDMPYITGSTAAQSYGRFSFLDGSLQAPYAVSGGQYTYVPYLEKGNFSTVAMAYVLKDWLHISAQPRTYLVLNEIYPFSDLALLEETADRLYRQGIPFIASVRPVFGNADFPAMKRYLEALTMVQSRNGSIIINAPAVRPPANSSDYTLHDQMNGFINVLVQGGVAPLGIGAEGYWTYDREYAGAGMDFFDSAVLYPDEEVRYMEQTSTSTAFPSTLYSLTPGFLESLQYTGKAVPQLPVDTAVTVNLPKDEEELESLLHTLGQSWITFADYKQASHKVATDTNMVTAAGGVIWVNGKELNVSYSLETVSSDYAYQEVEAESFTRLFSVQNRFFIVVLLLSLLLFGGLLTVGRRLYRKKYLK